MTVEYLRCYFDKYINPKIKEKYQNSFENFLEKELNSFINQLYVCALLNNFFWGVWCL